MYYSSSKARITIKNSNKKIMVKNQKNFNLNVKGYSLKIIRGTGDSNYNTFSHVFKNGEKSHLFGTSHNDNSTDNEIINWANNRLASHLSGGENKDLLNAFNQMI